jgi:SAM-dependent methyltransferase
MKNKEIQKHFDATIPGRFGDQYEFNRWFRHNRTREDFSMTHRALEYHLSKVDFGTCMEIGPGPGTWTTLLYRRNPDAVFQLVDISEEMKKQFELEMRSLPNIRYAISDFCEYSTGETYDLICSSRALEYVDNKELFVKKIHTAMSDGGHGLIITKNPNFRSYLPKKGDFEQRAHHQGKISYNALTSLLTATGFKNIRAYPVVIRLPLLDRINTAFSRKIFNRAHKQVMNKKISSFTESYIMSFEK